MTCVSYEFDAGKSAHIGRVILMSDDTPATFPMTTAGIAGLPVSNVPILPGSLLTVVKTGSLYVMSEDGTTWNEFGGEA